MQNFVLNTKALKMLRLCSTGLNESALRYFVENVNNDKSILSVNGAKLPQKQYHAEIVAKSNGYSSLDQMKQDTSDKSRVLLVSLNGLSCDTIKLSESEITHI
jgi:hypothetical protein